MTQPTKPSTPQTVDDRRTEVSDCAAESTPLSQSRRRVIRGFATVPAVMTIGNGFSAAAASLLECVTHGGIPTDPVYDDLDDLKLLTEVGWVESCNNTADQQYRTFVYTEQDNTGSTGYLYFHDGTTDANGDKFTLSKFNVDEYGNVGLCGGGESPLLASCHTSLVDTIPGRGVA